VTCIYFSEERIASILRVEDKAKQTTSTTCRLLILLLARLFALLTLKVKAKRWSEGWVNFYQTIRCRIQQPSTLQNPYIFRPINIKICFCFVGWDWVHLVRRPLIGLFVPAPDDRWVYGAFGGMIICRGNRSTRSKPTPTPLFPPPITHDLIWDRTWAPATNRLSYGMDYP
jgi:hypothetical protein